ncbi:MAG: SPOR domain-containing protein [Halanaerobiales bacterium]|nr:SPOR domain-containing protein [Halanaerobiales bacterium]
MSQQYGNSSISLIAGVILMAFVAIVGGYFVGSFVINFATRDTIDPTSTEPITDQIQLTGKPEEEGNDNFTTITIPESNYTQQTQMDGLYVIQLGAFNSRVNAERLKNELLEKGYPSVIVTEGPPYKVQLRASQTRKEAEDLKKQIKEDGYVDVFIAH